jgi:hypothetical protein
VHDKAVAADRDNRGPVFAEAKQRRVTGGCCGQRGAAQARNNPSELVSGEFPIPLSLDRAHALWLVRLSEKRRDHLVSLTRRAHARALLDSGVDARLQIGLARGHLVAKTILKTVTQPCGLQRHGSPETRMNTGV